MQMTALHIASRDGNATAVESLLATGADVHELDEDGAAPLYKASSWGHDSIVERLLKAGPDVNHEAKVHPSLARGWTALHRACWSAPGHVVIARLLAAGADLEAKTEDGRTPLMIASQRGSTSIIKELIEAGADIEAESEDGSTPLQWAIAHCRDTAVTQLTKYLEILEKRYGAGREAVEDAAVAV